MTGVPIIFGYDGVQIMAVLTRDLPDETDDSGNTETNSTNGVRKRKKGRTRNVGIYVKSIDFDGMVKNLIGTSMGGSSMKWLNGLKAGKKYNYV